LVDRDYFDETLVTAEAYDESWQEGYRKGYEEGVVERVENR
jgi:flagellar biosynthesis/type III secretory pathway protein FliH